MVTIPHWNALGLLPPIDPEGPTSVARSPYPVSLKDLVRRFATSPERKAILVGFLKYRAVLHRFGATEGFQWLDGSFMEEVEVLEKRTPKDIDVVSFIHGTLSEDADQYVEHSAAKASFSVDSYFVELDQIPPREVVLLSSYWYSMWSHRRNQAWKGFLQVELAPNEDAEALEYPLAGRDRRDTVNRSDRQHLLAEQKFLETRLLELPAAARLTRMSVKAQLGSLTDQLLETTNEREPARVRLTFNGRPVVGTHGIFAEFGMKAVNGFTDTVAIIAASLTMHGPLAQMGPIPNREQNQLLIIGPALGSFGFELEEYRGQMILDEASPVTQALEKTQNLLKGTLGTDEELADSASETDLRALEKMRSFLSTLVENEAICTMEFHEQSVRFKDVGEVRTSLARLGRDNLQEEDAVISGAFEGALPTGRTFEFRLRDTQEVIRGKILQTVQNVDALNDHRHEPVEIKVSTTRVGNGRPRYVLREMPSWVATNPL